MQITSVYSYLVMPDKNAETKRPVSSTAVPISGKLFAMLSEVFLVSDEECTVPIRFLPAEDGKQCNPMRERLLEYVNRPSEHRGMRIAEGLRDVSTLRSGMGLLFLMHGRSSDSTHKCVISRFPADQGVVANPVAGKLKIDFVEQVFMKNAKAYKAAMYHGKATSHGLWDGVVVDKQINSGVQHVADYWIRAFLRSDLKTTSKAGTRRLADAVMAGLRKAVDIETKQELTAAIMLAGKQLVGKTLSVSEFCSRYSLSDKARDLVAGVLPNTAAFTDKFVFDQSEFQVRARLRSVSLDNGATLTAEAAKFEECFKTERLRGTGSGVRMSTEGLVVDDRIKGR